MNQEPPLVPNRCQAAFSEARDMCLTCGDSGIRVAVHGCGLPRRRKRILGWIGLAAVAVLVLGSLAACETAPSDPFDAEGFLSLDRGPGGCIQRRWNSDRRWHWGIGSCRMGLRPQ